MCVYVGGVVYCVRSSIASPMVVFTSVNEEYWAVTHRSSAYMKLRVPSWIGWSLV